MYTLIVYCHPYEGNFNHAVLEALCARYDRADESYRVIDLYADGFDPALSSAELAVYSAGEVLDPLVVRYQELVAGCCKLVFVFPIWWNDMPAMLRGWFDKVMLAGFSWIATGEGLEGTLTHIASAEVYTTSANPTAFIRERAGDGIQRALIDGTLRQLGISHGTWVNFGGMDASTPEERSAYLAKIAEG